MKLKLKVSSELDANIREKGSFKQTNHFTSRFADPDVSKVDVLTFFQIESLGNTLQAKGEESHLLIELS